MQESQNTSKFYDNLWAAFIFFTRLPFWRIYQPPKEAYQGVVEFWPLAGWLTAGVMASVLYGASMVFNYEIAIVLAIVSRLLLTGATPSLAMVTFRHATAKSKVVNNKYLVIRFMKVKTFWLLSILGCTKIQHLFHGSREKCRK